MNKDKEYERISKLLNTKLPKPTTKQIEETISLIEARLAEKKINKFMNAPVKEGYTKALDVLRGNDVDLPNISTIQGRSIALIAFDYLKGECSQDVLCNVPLK